MEDFAEDQKNEQPQETPPSKKKRVILEWLKNIPKDDVYYEQED